MEAGKSAESTLERGVKTLTEWAGAAVGAVLGWNAVAPELGVLAGATSALVGGVIGKAATAAVVR